MKLFDLDGTLIDSNGVWLEVDRRFLSRRGLKVTAEYSDAVVHSIFPIAAEFTKRYYSLPDTPEKIMAEWMALAEEDYAHRIPLKPGAKEFLAQERARGEALVLVTASVPELAALVLERHGLTAFFQEILFAQHWNLEKRDPRFFSRLLEHLSAPPEQCVLYEDAPDNCAAAKAAGLTVVGVWDGFYAAREAEVRSRCQRYIHSFEELLS